MIEPRATICSTENLENIEIKFSEDMLDREFIVKLYNLEMPKSSTPGLMGYYMFNGDYTAFASSQLNWSTLTNTLQDYSQIIEPVLMEWSFDGRGVRADLVITVTPNLNIDTSKVFYIKFSPEFMSNLSIFEIYTYVESDKSVLRNWIVSSRILAITGWTYGLDGGRPFGFRITGIDIPGVDKTRSIQLMVGGESGLAA